MREVPLSRFTIHVSRIRLTMAYFNHQIYHGIGWWGRREFIGYWWRLCANDDRFTPPPYPTLAWALNSTRNPHLARLSPDLLSITALPRRETPHEFLDPQHWVATASVLEVPVGTAVLLQDPRRHDHTAYLALSHFANDETSLDVFFNHLSETLAVEGYQRLIGPVGLSPHLGSGVLLDTWSEYPPLHTPYNPPYLPELLDNTGEALETIRLYHLPVTAEPVPTTPAQLIPLQPERLATDLLPLFAAATESHHFPPVDGVEAAFLLRWLDPTTLTGWVAQVKRKPVGFVLLQPDFAPRLRLVKGGKNRLWRLWWVVTRKRPTRSGRLLFWGVLPAWRGQGIGRQLLQQAIGTAHRPGWQQLTIGPVAEGNSAVSLLEEVGARPRQSYQLYEWQL